MRPSLVHRNVTDDKGKHDRSDSKDLGYVTSLTIGSELWAVADLFLFTSSRWFPSFDLIEFQFYFRSTSFLFIFDHIFQALFEATFVTVLPRLSVPRLTGIQLSGCSIFLQRFKIKLLLTTPLCKLI